MTPTSVSPVAKDILADLLVPLILGALGAAVYLCRNGVRTWRQCAASVISSVFTAILVFWLLDLADFPPTVDAAFTGLAGYAGGSLLDAFHARAIRAVDCIPGPGQSDGHEEHKEHL